MTGDDSNEDYVTIALIRVIVKKDGSNHKIILTTPKSFKDELEYTWKTLIWLMECFKESFNKSLYKDCKKRTKLRKKSEIQTELDIDGKQVL